MQVTFAQLQSVFATHREYVLNKSIHDDGDCIKWDWEVYRYVKNKACDEMYEFVCWLEISPYERDENLIVSAFENMAEMMFTEEYWSEGPIFS